MAVQAQAVEVAAARYALLRAHLDERARRLLLGVEASQLGRGGIAAVSAATGVHPDTIARGVREIAGEPEPSARVRAAGAGRRPLTVTDSGLTAVLEALLEPDTRGDPMSPLRWTSKSTRRLAAQLTAAGHPVSDRTVAKLLTGMGFSLQANTKTLEGAGHPDRDAQFRYLTGQVAAFTGAGQPVVSVDAKKKELVGAFKNAGREYARVGHPVPVKVHDFLDPELGKAIPYGIYDVAADEGWVSVGTDHDTSAFAVATLTCWWDTIGRTRYPGADQLLICADSGGSNGSRVRAWKIELAAFAAATGLAVTVVHLPPGTSKWNKIEHRLFSQISMNWRARPLRTHQVIVDLIRHTTTHTGLTVHAVLDTDAYPTGLRYNKTQIDALPMTRHPFHGDWNYTINPPDTPKPRPN